MRIFRSAEEIPDHAPPSAVTIGNFDGVHIGHRRIFDELKSVSAANGWASTVLTFDPHPTRVVAPERAPKLMTTVDQRMRLMAREGIEQALILPFTSEVAMLSPEAFVKELLVDRLKARAVFVGENFRFGHRQTGDTHMLTDLGHKFGFQALIAPAVECRGRMVSSTAIRRLIEAGKVGQAGRFLGRPYALEGEVVPGRGVGSKLTAPTLNLGSTGELIPARGVYVTRTRDLEGSREWQSVTNVGYRPTFGASEQLSVETFLLDPLEGATPSRIAVAFLARMRDERKFENPEALRAQILRDVTSARSYFRRLEKWTGAACPPAIS